MSLKADAKTALGNPTSEAYADIVASQASDDGTSIDFYSNSFTKGAADGSTTASFSPNAGNKFYYYTQDTTLYTNPECTTEANWYTARNANTLYYKDVYWVQTGNGNGAREVTDGYGTVTSGTAEWNAIVRPYQGDAYYIPANTQRTERPHTLTDGKDANATGTAANVLNPSWTEAGDVTQALGNNGKLSFEKPGSLEIKKNVDWGNASDQTKQEKNTFTFDITANVPTGEGEATEALTGTYNYYVGDSDTAAGQVTFNNGSATLTVTGGTTVRIDGLPAGTTFTVTEQGVGQNGWTVTDATSQEDAENTSTTDGMVTGTIPAGSQASLTFSNTYHADEVGLNTNTTLKVQKNLEGRDWRDTDEFTFEIDGLGNTAGTDVTTPEPAGTTITVNSQTPDHTASFGDITFTMPGEYRYSIVEDNDTNPIAGIDYSGAFYRVVVTVTDNGTGNLEVSNVAIEQRTNDDGVENDPAVAVQGDTVTFVNKYDADGGTTNIDGTKDYTDNVGGNPINADKFTFKIEALGGYDTDNPQTNPYTYGVDEVPLPAGSDEASHSKTVYNTGYSFTFGTIAFDGGDLGRTYEYKVTELAQNKDGQAEAGMTYDKTEHTVKVTVTEVSDDDGTHIVATPDITPQELKFTNTYDPADATLTGNDAIHGTKTLTGRDMKAGETFYFQLKATNANAQSVLPNAQTVKVTSLTDGSANFDFGEMSFSKVGKYTFTVNEVADENGTETTNGSGMIYDSNICTVTVDVTDNHDGTLKADVTYSNSAHSSVADKAQFNNTYEASMNYGAEGAGGIVVTKTLNNRSEAKGTFLFTITGETEEDTAKLHEEDLEFTHGILTPGVPNEMEKLQQLTFDETDAGKTYTFFVDELEDRLAGNKPLTDLEGVDFDQSQYRVDIQVLDNGNGTMHTVTTVTKTMNKDGSVANEVVCDHLDSASDGYTAPKFGFVNDYNPDPAVVGGSADAKIQVTKTVEGADSATDYTFTLTLVEQDKAQYIEGLSDGKLEVSTNGTITEGDSKTVEFGELKFTKAGSYGFTVTEKQPAEDAGWTFDDADGDGFTDTHHVEIVITDKNADGKYDGKLYVESVTSDAGLDQPVQITNSYKTDPVVVGGEDAEQQITVQKSVTGDNTAADAEFNFQLEPVVDDTNTEDVWRANVEAAEDGFEPKTTITGGVTTDASKTATFGGIRFKAAGDYTFKVTEVEGTDDQADPSGWTYDGHEALVTVHVTDDGEGKLKATVSYNNDDATTDADKAVDNAAAFTNSYSTSSTNADTGSADVQLTKVLEGKAWEGDSFMFQIAADKSNSDAPMPEETEVTVSTPTGKDDNNNDQATFDFGSITFDTPGTYVYKVTEVKGNNAGITYSKNEATITITVTDNHDGTLGIVVAYPDGGDGLTFRNTYGEDDQGKVTLNINGTKTLDVQSGNNAPSIEGKYTFTLTGSEGAPMPATTEAHNDASGNVTFGDITFTMENVFGDTGVQEAAAADENAADVGNDEEAVDSEASGESGAVSNEADVDAQSATRTKEFTYTVTESGNVSGVDNDTETSKTFMVTVTDNGDGSLSVESNPAQGALFSFTNTYNVDLEESSPTGEGGITITKNLDGRNLNDGEFTFELVDQNNTVVATGTNDANGTVELDTVKFTEPGNFTYTIREAKGSLGGVDYDAVQYKATATVTDNGDGTLKVEWSFADASNNGLGENASITFNNTYTAQPTSVSLGTGKLIEGRALAAGEFTFKLTDADGNEISTATNEENGAVTFDTITYDTPGDYTYTITEVVPQDTDPFTDGIQNNGVTYDESVYNATVKVTDNGKGNLTAQISYSTEDGAAPLFVNTYTAPAESEQGTDDGGLFGMAKTGDFMGGMMAVIAAVIVAAAGGAAYALRKMRRPRGRHAR